MNSAKEGTDDSMVLPEHVESLPSTQRNQTLLRRSLVFAILYFGLIIPFRGIHNLLYALTVTIPSGFWISLVLGSILCTVMLFIILLHWKKQEGKGKEPWYQKYSTGSLGGILVALCLCTVFGNILISIYGHEYDSQAPEAYFEGGAILNSLYFMNLLSFSFSAIFILGWFLWFDIARKSRKEQFLIVTAYALFQGVVGITGSFISLTPINASGESYFPIQGTTLATFENFLLILNDKLLHLGYYSMRNGFTDALMVGFLCALWMLYRKRIPSLLKGRSEG